MNQPNLGHKVAELRQQKGLTQERLAEMCEVSARTIQRIESGEVDPRAYTLRCLGEALDFDFGDENISNEDLWLAALHLSSIFCILIIPLALWSWKKRQSCRIDLQGRQVLNFQITVTLSLFMAFFVLMLAPAALVVLGESGGLAEGGSAITWLTLCLPMPLIFIGLFCFYQGVANAVRSLSDKPVHYPLSIPFVS